MMTYHAQISETVNFDQGNLSLIQATHPLMTFNYDLIFVCLFVWFLAFIIKGGEYQD
ncbi:hypothetical protein [Lyngbya aestuarii]|uniref:hypothetical protein n=1 Tax=Lyngbya aestuarii TaxID=118322 RepID=UPI00403DE220